MSSRRAGLLLQKDVPVIKGLSSLLIPSSYVKEMVLQTAHTMPDRLAESRNPQPIHVPLHSAGVPNPRCAAELPAGLLQNTDPGALFWLLNQKNL